jgi:hypothetical protein
MREWTLKHPVVVSVIAGTAVGLALFTFGGHADMEPVNIGLSALLGAVFGVSFLAARRATSGRGEPPKE